MKDTNFLLACSELGLSNLACNCWRLGFADLYVEQEVGPRAEGIKRNLNGSALLAFDAELVLKRNYEWTEKREFRLKQRNPEVIRFLMRACVKENRNPFLCRWSDCRA